MVNGKKARKGKDAPKGRGRIDADVADEVIDTLGRLLRGKADAYELFFSRDMGLSVEALDKTVDALKVRSNEGVGLRVILKGRLGFGFSSVLAGDALKEMVKKTIDGSTEATSDKDLRFPSGVKQVGAAGTELEISDDSYGTAPEEEKINAAIALEEGAKAASPKIARIRKASYQESMHFTRLVNSNGVDVASSSTFFSGSVTAIAEDMGDSQMGWEIGMAHKRSLIEPVKIGATAAQNALRMLGARRIPTARCPAVIENTVACELLEAFLGSFLADNVHKGKSMLIGKVGKKVVSKSLNVWDDGLLKGGWGTSSFDGEGVSRQKTPLLTEGAVNGFLYDTYWAQRDGIRSTGNASRSNYKSLPGVGISNIYIGKGRVLLEGLLTRIDKGLFITEILGAHTINSVSGDFSLGAAGLWVEGGKIQYPVRGMAIAGNLLGLFSKVEECGSDLRFIGSIGAPSLLVSELEASGQ